MALDPKSKIYCPEAHIETLKSNNESLSGRFLVA